MTSQQLNVRNLGIGLHIQEEQCENVHLLKVNLLVQISGASET